MAAAAPGRLLELWAPKTTQIRHSCEAMRVKCHAEDGLRWREGPNSRPIGNMTTRSTSLAPVMYMDTRVELIAPSTLGHSEFLQLTACISILIQKQKGHENEENIFDSCPFNDAAVIRS